MVLLVLLFSLYLHYRLVKPIREIDLREEMDWLAAAESSAPADGRVRRLRISRGSAHRWKSPGW